MHISSVVFVVTKFNEVVSGIQLRSETFSLVHVLQLEV